MQCNIDGCPAIAALPGLHHTQACMQLHQRSLGSLLPGTAHTCRRNDNTLSH